MGTAGAVMLSSDVQFYELVRLSFKVSGLQTGISCTHMSFGHHRSYVFRRLLVYCMES